LQAVFPLIFEPFLPPQVDFVLSTRAIVEGMVLGFVVATIFTLLPIYQLQGFKPRFIFRKEASIATRSRVFFLAQGLILLFISAMTFRYLQNTLRTAYFAVGLVSLILVITLLTRAVLFVLKRQKIKALDIRQAVRGLFRPRNVTAGIIVTLAASLSVLFTIFLIERNLAASFVQAYPEDAPNIILLDIQPDQRQGIREFLSADAEFVPLVLARISQINGTAVVREEPDTPQFGPDQGPDGPIELDSLFPTTYRDELAAGERLVGPGEMFSAEELGVAQVSISDRVLEAYPFSIGDRIQFEIQGVNLEAQVSSIRALQEDDASFGPRFNFVFREQDLITAPQTIVTADTIPEGEVSEFQNRLVSLYPNVTVINISAAIDVLAVLVDDITVVIRFFSVFSIVAGVLIIISSVLATQYARIQESVYYKVLGAKRLFVLRVFALENIFIGLVSALLALFLSQAASWLLITQVFEISYAAFWGPSVLLMVFTIALVTTVGLLASVSILKKKPISFLREQSVE
jgi:putative ABC transport system permease protein